MQTSKERLIKLLDIGSKLAVDKEHKYNSMENKTLLIQEMIADYLLDNGVIVLPCKLGDHCYQVTKYHSIVDCTVSAIHYGRPLKQSGMIMTRQSDKESEYIVLRSNVTGYVSDRLSFKDFQENVYFTHEEAEQALKEEKDENTRIKTRH